MQIDQTSIGRGAAIAALSLVCGPVSTARAWAPIATCVTPVMMDGSLNETRNGCSIPDNSTSYYAYMSAVSRWSEVSKKQIEATWVRDPNDCRTTQGDWWNEVSRKNRSNIDGRRNGITTYSHVNFCAVDPLGGGDYGETDANVANDMNFDITGVPGDRSLARPAEGSPTLPRGGGAMTFVHEIGHQMGLNHYVALNVMTDSTNRPVRPRVTSSGTWADLSPMADELAGIHAIYGGSKTVTNVFPLASRLSGSSVIDIGPNDGLVCRGAPLNITLSVMNVSSSSVTFKQKFFAGSSLIFEVSNLTMSARTTWTGTYAANVPSNLPDGTHLFKHVVDSSSQVTEYDEADNQVTYKGRLIISC